MNVHDRISTSPCLYSQETLSMSNGLKQE